MSVDPIRNWSGFDLWRFADIHENEVAGAIENLRRWCEKTAPDGGVEHEPSGRMFEINTADDLAAASKNRRDACFVDFLGFVQMITDELYPPPLVDRLRERPVLTLAKGFLGLIGEQKKEGHGYHWHDDGKHEATETFPFKFKEFKNSEINVNYFKSDHTQKKETEEEPIRPRM